MQRRSGINVGLLCIGLLLSLCTGEVKVVSNEVEAQKPIQLTEGTFDSEVRRVPSSYGLIIEFYAHWYGLVSFGCLYFLLITVAENLSCSDQVPNLASISAGV